MRDGAPTFTFVVQARAWPEENQMTPWNVTQALTSYSRRWRAARNRLVPPRHLTSSLVDLSKGEE